MGPSSQEQLFQDWLSGTSVGDLVGGPDDWTDGESLALEEPIVAPLLPLRDVVVYPNMVTPLFVGRDRSIRAVNVANEGDGYITPRGDQSIGLELTLSGRCGRDNQGEQEQEESFKHDFVPLFVMDDCDWPYNQALSFLQLFPMAHRGCYHPR